MGSASSVAVTHGKCIAPSRSETVVISIRVSDHCVAPDYTRRVPSRYVDAAGLPERPGIRQLAKHADWSLILTFDTTGNSNLGGKV